MQIKHRELHRITSTAIICKDKKYLIVRRALNKKNFPGRWIVPGGGLEVDDYINLPKTTPDSWYFALEKSLRREIKEEVNLEVKKLKYLLDVALISIEGIPILILSFYCDYKSGKVKLNEENIDYKWVTFEQEEKYDFFEGILEEIEMVDKILKGTDPDKTFFNNKKIN
jgi:8-oxo-dGTP pyrophosphatase MutT (NUDIX family)